MTLYPVYTYCIKLDHLMHQDGSLYTLRFCKDVQATDVDKVMLLLPKTLYGYPTCTGNLEGLWNQLYNLFMHLVWMICLAVYCELWALFASLFFFTTRYWRIFFASKLIFLKIRAVFMFQGFWSWVYESYLCYVAEIIWMCRSVDSKTICWNSGYLIEFPICTYSVSEMSCQRARLIY